MVREGGGEEKGREEGWREGGGERDGGRVEERGMDGERKDGGRVEGVESPSESIPNVQASRNAGWPSSSTPSKFLPRDNWDWSI